MKKKSVKKISKPQIKLRSYSIGPITSAHDTEKITDKRFLVNFLPINEKIHSDDISGKLYAELHKVLSKYPSDYPFLIMNGLKIIGKKSYGMFHFYGKKIYLRITNNHLMDQKYYEKEQAEALKKKSLRQSKKHKKVSSKSSRKRSGTGGRQGK